MPAVLYDKYPDDHYAVFTLNRPEQLNAQNKDLREAFEEALQDFEMDNRIRCGIVTGAGRAFSAGADLKEVSALNAAVAELNAQLKAGAITLEERNAGIRKWTADRAGLRLSGHPKPFIAAINGACVANGMERATDCDIRIASTEAYFGVFEVKRGIMAGYAIEHLARVMPFGEASYLLLSADRLSVEDAFRLGFVHEVVAPDRLMPRAIEIAKMICANAPLAVQGTKAVLSFWRRHGLEESNKLHQWVRRAVWASEDAKEGPRAFAEKRPPIWKGR